MARFGVKAEAKPKRANQNNKTPTNPSKQVYRSMPPSSHPKQIQSRIQYSNQSQQTELNIDKLDLIFQRQHKDIQQKLVKLLLTYNAVLQYNKDTDMFQVDLLLPFVNDQQKKEFIRKFLEIRRSKNTNRVHQGFLLHQSQKNQKKASVGAEGYSYNFNKQERKFSFNTNYNKKQQSDAQNSENQPQQNESIIEQSSEFHKENQRDAEEDFRSQHESSVLSQLKNQELNMPIIEEVLKNKLKKAINLINLKKGKIGANDNNNNSNSILINDDQPKEEQSFITKFIESSSYPLRQQNDRIIANGFIKVDDEQGQSYPRQKSQERKQQKFNKSLTYNSGQIYENVIDEQYQEEENQPLFDKKIVINKSEKITTFQEYNNRYNTLKQQKKEKNMPKKVGKNQKKINNEVEIAKNYYSSKEKHQKILPNQSSNSLKRSQSKNKGQQDKSQSTNKNIKTDKKYEPLSQQKFKEFFEHHKKHLQTIYSEIRNKIKIKQRVPKPKSIQKPQKSQEKSSSLQKKSQDLFILVQDDEDSQQQLFGEQVQNIQQFKNQVFKSYKREIIVNNKNLSSQDLVRYFRYLHTNAKKLYLKYNKNVRK